MDINTTFANNMRSIRLKKHISQEKLAELCHLHRTYISLVERGQRNISLKNVEKIAEGLGIEPYILLISGDKNDKN